MSDSLSQLGFQVHRKIGQGAWGEVYRVERNSVVCAAKVGRLDRDFRAEGRIHLQIDHPFCVPALEYHETNTHGVLVMPLLTPPPTQVDEATAARFTWQLLCALSYLHNMEWAHNDVKPENLLYDSVEDKIMLVDFGACCPLTDELRNEDIKWAFQCTLRLTAGAPKWLLYLSTVYTHPYEKLYAMIPVKFTALSPITTEEVGMLRRIEHQFCQELNMCLQFREDSSVWHEEHPRLVVSRRGHTNVSLHVTWDKETLIKNPCYKAVEFMLRNFRSRVKMAWRLEAARLVTECKTPADTYALHPRFLPCLRIDEARDILEHSGLICLLDGRYVATADAQVTVTLQENLWVMLQGPIDRTFLRWEHVFEPGRFVKNVDKVLGWIGYILSTEEETLGKWCQNHQQLVEELLSQWLHRPIQLKLKDTKPNLVCHTDHLYPDIYYSSGKLHFTFRTRSFELTLLQIYMYEPGPQFKRLVQEAVISDRRKTRGYALWAEHEMRVSDLLLQHLGASITEDVFGFHLDKVVVVPEQEMVFYSKKRVPLAQFLDDPMAHIPLPTVASFFV